MLSGERRCRLDQLPKVLFIKGEAMKASDKQVVTYTGFTADGLAPAGAKKAVPVAIDVALKAHEVLIAQGGDAQTFLELGVPELKRLSAGIVSYALAEEP